MGLSTSRTSSTRLRGHGERPIDMHLKDIVNGGTIEPKRRTQGARRPGNFVRPCASCTLPTSRCLPDPGDRQLVEAGIKQVAPTRRTLLRTLTRFLAMPKRIGRRDELAAMVADFAANADRIAFPVGCRSHVGDFMEEHDGLLDGSSRRGERGGKVIEVVESGGDPTTVVALPEVEAA